MVWSNWRGAVVVMLAWVGLAWSQAPVASVATSERIMTVHENGKGLRCRVMSQWRTPAGATACQLQVIGTGEMMTIVEDGPPTTVQEPKAGKLKALPMRIFHWGRNRVPPPGVPAPPTMIAAAAHSDNCACDQCQVGHAHVTTAGTGNCAPCNEQVVWWEDKNGQRVLVATKNSTTGAPGAPLPVVTDRKPDGKMFPVTTVPSIGDNTVTRVVTIPGKVEAPRMATSGPALRSVVPGTPIPMVTMPAGPGVYTEVVDETSKKSVWHKMFPGTTSKPQVVQVVPEVQVAKTNPGQAAPRSPVTQSVPANLAGKTTLPAQTSTSKPALPTVQTMPTKNPGAKVQGTMAQTSPTQLPTKTVQKDTPPTNAASALNTKPLPMPANGPKRETTVVQNTPKTGGAAPKPATVDLKAPAVAPKTATVDPKTATAPLKAPETKPLAGVEKPVQPKAATQKEERPPFSTATVAGATVKNLPPSLSNSADNKGLSISTPGKQPSGALTPKDKHDETRPSVQIPAKKDWRTMWGQAKETKVQAPGHSTVEQASVKPDPKTVPSLQNPQVIPATLPPSSMVEKNPGDILLTPEKFDPTNDKLAPRGINMNAYRGDPNKSLQLVQAAPAPQTNAALPPLVNGSKMPLGAQSVLAAGSNMPNRLTYIPVPVATVPEPYRPPVPPAPKVPDAPQLNAYVNAFAPQQAPQEKQPQNAMMVNAFSNMSPPANQPQMAQGYPQGYGPNPYQFNPYAQQAMHAQMMMAQGYPMVPGYPPQQGMMVQGMPMQAMPMQGMPMHGTPYYGSQAQGVAVLPMMSPQGRPVAQINYPQNYQGPQPPNPMTPQMQQPIQPIQYNPAAMQQPAVNMAMDRPRQTQTQQAANQELVQVIQVLRESPYPAQREWASNTLSTYDWRVHPEVVQVLLQGAQQDPAATVRASCAYSLGRMNAASEPVITTLHTLRNDGDPRVRHEVEQALIRLGASRP